ncbi:MAG: purine-nucleoside phosphorylase [bacterium]
MDNESALISSIKEAAGFLLETMDVQPRIGLFAGTGLECLCDLLSHPRSIPTHEIPHFPHLGAHERRLLWGTIQEHPALVLSKRLHGYEGYSMHQIAFVVRLFLELGVRILIISNAAGGLDPLHKPGELMLITDHINLMGSSPLIGPNIDAYGPRFPDMSAPYDADLIRMTEQVALKQKIAIWKGTYVAVTGPNLETRAETRFLRNMGADAVGMSTVPEVITAVHCGIRVLGISVLSNVNIPDCQKSHTLEEIVENVYRTAPVLKGLIKGILDVLPQECEENA